MKEDFFKEQMARLKVRFGPKAFDSALTELVAAEVATMTEEAFMKLVSFLIGSRAVGRPPLLQDFRDGRLAAERNRLSKDLDQSHRVLSQPASNEGLKSVLARDYKGAKTALEAVHIQKLRNQIKKANEDQ